MKAILTSAILLATLAFARPVSSEDGSLTVSPPSAQVAERASLGSFKILDAVKLCIKFSFVMIHRSPFLRKSSRPSNKPKPFAARGSFNFITTE